jgi:succinate dehydrogenase/fumarate reductase cytochrome b subunit
LNLLRYSLHRSPLGRQFFQNVTGVILFFSFFVLGVCSSSAAEKGEAFTEGSEGLIPGSVKACFHR